MKYSNVVVVIILCVSTGLLMGCGASKAVQGGAIGAGGGAVIGGIIGNQFGSTAAGAIIGAAIGGTAGALIGHHMDKQAEEMRQDLKNAKIERVGEGIKITFDSGILFAVNSAEAPTRGQIEYSTIGDRLEQVPGHQHLNRRRYRQHRHRRA